MDGGIACEILQHKRGINQLACDFLAVVGLFEFSGLFERFFQRDLEFIRNHLGQSVHLTVAKAHNAADIADDGLRAHRAEGDGLGHAIAPIFFPAIFDDCLALVIGKIDVNVGRVNAPGI